MLPPFGPSAHACQAAPLQYTYITSLNVLRMLLITGATGHIGAAVLQQLLKKQTLASWPG